MISDKKGNIEFIEEKTERKEHKFGSIKDLLDGSLIANDFILKQLPYIVFLVILAFIYIANRYHAEKIVRGTSKMEIKLKELKSEHIAIASELMQISKQSEVAKRVRDRNINLEEATEAPIKIETIE